MEVLTIAPFYRFFIKDFTATWLNQNKVLGNLEKFKDYIAEQLIIGVIYSVN